jgi:hypothetical protein
MLLTLICCSWIVLKISMDRIILTTCADVLWPGASFSLSNVSGMYERIRCEVQPLPVPDGPSPPSVVAWAYEYCMSPPQSFRLVPDGNWASLMRSEHRCE